MMRSLFAGVSGMKNHQVRMDVIGNNIANVNTLGFKAGRVTFKEGFAQLLQGASRPPGDHGGINPIQVGLGMQIGSIDQLFTQGNIETTGVNTDLAIQGDSFFVVAKGNQHFYTRSGNFQLDADGRVKHIANGDRLRHDRGRHGLCCCIGRCRMQQDEREHEADRTSHDQRRPCRSRRRKNASSGTTYDVPVRTPISSTPTRRKTRCTLACSCAMRSA